MNNKTPLHRCKRPCVDGAEYCPVHVKQAKAQSVLRAALRPDWAFVVGVAADARTETPQGRVMHAIRPPEGLPPPPNLSTTTGAAPITRSPRPPSAAAPPDTHEHSPAGAPHHGETPAARAARMRADALARLRRG